MPGIIISYSTSVQVPGWDFPTKKKSRAASRAKLGLLTPGMEDLWNSIMKQTTRYYFFWVQFYSVGKNNDT